MQIIGHQKTLNFLEKSIEKKATSGAYLFCGVEHLGKFTVALDFAKKITGTEADINPDIIIIRPEIEEKKSVIKKKDIKVEQVRELQRGLAMTPHFGQMKVAIVDDAQRLTVAAQNALLKTLEEPDEKSVLILICHNQEKILATIRSRCSIRNFNAVGANEIIQVLPGGAMSEAAIFWALGRPGLAIEFFDHPEKLQALEKARAELRNLFQNNLTDKFSLAEELSKDTERLEAELQTWTILLRQNIISGGNFLGVKLEKSLEVLEGLAKSGRIIQETNSNAKVVLENLFLKF